MKLNSTKILIIGVLISGLILLGLLISLRIEIKQSDKIIDSIKREYYLDSIRNNEIRNSMEIDPRPPQGI